MGKYRTFPQTLQSLTFAFLLIIVFYKSGIAQPKYDKQFFSTYRIEDPALIDSLLDEFMLPKEGVRTMEFIDINENGPDDKDILRVTSEGGTAVASDLKDGEMGEYQVIALSAIGLPETVRERMLKWGLGKNRLKTTILPNLEAAKEFHELTKSAKSSIVVTTLTALFQNYPQNEFKLMLERSPTGQIVFSIVGFDETDATYKAPWDPNKDMDETLVQEMSGNEVMRAFFENLKRQFQSELVIMYRERIDTVYINDSNRAAKGR